jgi:hypothetical protein
MFRKGMILAVLNIAMLSSVAVSVNAAGLGEECGGIGEIGCDSGLWCDLQPGLCDAADISGICVEIPSACAHVVKPVCACSGFPYTNDCERQKSQIAKSHNGKCTPPFRSKRQHPL